MTDQILKASATVRELAALLTTLDGRRSLQMLGCASQAMADNFESVFERIANEALPGLNRASGARIGIWDQEGVGEASSFLRHSGLEPLELWSEMERIPPRRHGIKRVVLLGESVARGFFYDPFFNPAAALERMLASVLGQEIEVIDLARIDIGMHQLLELCKSALLLNPDALVIWAGNNWHPAQFFTDGRLPEVGLRLRKERKWAPMKTLLDETLKRSVSAFASTLGRLSLRSGVPFLLVLPEVNLGDWRDASTPPPLLSSDDTSRWLDLRAEANLSVQRQNVPHATSLAHKMLKIDAGTTPETYYILADASRISGNLPESLRLLRLSREVSLCWPRAFSPATYSAARNDLAHLAPSCGFEMIDLSERLMQYLGGSLPDRRLFHDYCHMTELGTRLSMAWAAEWLMPKLTGPRCGMERFAAVDHRLPSDVTASANFLAAVVNGDNGQSQEIVRYHLTQALNSSPEVSARISLFLDFRIRRTPALVCESLERLLTSFRLTGFHLLHGQGRRNEEKTLNLPLVEDCLYTLNHTDPSATTCSNALLEAEHGVSTRDIDLLESGYAISPYVRQMYRGRIAFYRAFDPISTFFLICDKPGSVRLHLTARVSEAPLMSILSIHVNGTVTATLPVAQHWANGSVIVPEHLLCLGHNEIAIKWPDPHWDHNSWIDLTAGLFEAGIVPEISPVFGHLAELRAEQLPRTPSSSSAVLNGSRLPKNGTQ